MWGCDLLRLSVWVSCTKSRPKPYKIRLWSIDYRLSLWLVPGSQPAPGFERRQPFKAPYPSVSDPRTVSPPNLARAGCQAGRSPAAKRRCLTPRPAPGFVVDPRVRDRGVPPTLRAGPEDEYCRAAECRAGRERPLVANGEPASRSHQGPIPPSCERQPGERRRLGGGSSVAGWRACEPTRYQGTTSQPRVVPAEPGGPQARDGTRFASGGCANPLARPPATASCNHGPTPSRGWPGTLPASQRRAPKGPP